MKLRVKKRLKKFLKEFDGLKKVKDNHWRAKCPGHDDKNPSLSITLKDNRILLKCHAGCETETILERIGKTFFDLNLKKNVVHTSTISTQHSNSGLSLKTYANFKKIPEEFLKDLGLATTKYRDQSSLKIPYFNQKGDQTGTRYRIALEGDRFRWKKGSKISLYGLWKLKEALKEEYLILVEGESDCHTLWHNGFPALGIPGAANWNENRDTPYLDGIPNIYLVVEPDQGGEVVVSRFGKSSLKDQIYCLEFDDFKDPSSLYLNNPEKFQVRFENIIKQAKPLTELLTEQSAKEKEKAWELCQDLAMNEDILDLFTKDLYRLGVVGEKRVGKILYLAMTTRLFERPVSVVIKGGSSSGKSFLTKKVLDFFPKKAFYELTSVSEKALIYSDESFKHRFIIFFEVVGLRGGFLDYIIRTLLSEGCLKYEVTEKGEDGKFKTRLLEKEGPTGFITTTTKLKLHPENETRYFSADLNESIQQTRKIVLNLGREGKGDQRSEDPGILIKWQAFQKWLEYAHLKAQIPYAEELGKLIDPRATRVRRDFTKILNLIRAHAVIHQKTRKVKEGVVIARIKDYAAIYDLVANLVSVGVEASITKQVRETVKAIIKIGKESRLYPVSLTNLARVLKLNKSTIKRRVDQAIELGYLRNEEEKPGKPAKIVIGDPMPRDKKVIPLSEDLRKAYLASKKGNK